MEKKQAIQILNSRTPISAPGKYRVKTTSCFDFNKELSNGAQVVAIANFSAMTPYQKEQAIEDLKAGENAKALNHNLNISIRDTDYRPAKGERVDIDVDYITTKSGEQALMVTGVTQVQATISSSKMDFSEFLDEAEAVATEVVAEEEELD